MKVEISLNRVLFDDYSSPFEKIVKKYSPKQPKTTKIGHFRLLLWGNIFLSNKDRRKT